MKAEIRDNKLFIEIDMQEPTPSKSGNTLLVASTHGTAKTAATVDGKPVSLTLSAWIKP